MPTKPLDKLPSLVELEATRKLGISNALTGGLVDAITRVVIHLGENMEVKNYVGTFKKLITSGIHIDYYLHSLSFIPIINEPKTRTIIRIVSDKKMFVNLEIHNPGTITENISFVVPGEWEKVIWKLDKQIQEEQDKEEAEKDLAIRVHLANLLQIEY